MADDSPRCRPAPDGCIVETAPLAALVRSFVDTWERDHCTSTNARDRTGRRNPGSRSLRDASGRFSQRQEMASGVAALAEITARAALPHGGEGVPPRAIHKVLRKQYRTTELRIADPLVAAIEHTEAFHNGTLTIRANPKAAPEDRAACCSGSLTGA